MGCHAGPRRWRRWYRTTGPAWWSRRRWRSPWGPRRTSGTRPRSGRRFRIRRPREYLRRSGAAGRDEATCSRLAQARTGYLSAIWRRRNDACRREGWTWRISSPQGSWWCWFLRHLRQTRKCCWEWGGCGGWKTRACRWAGLVGWRAVSAGRWWGYLVCGRRQHRVQRLEKSVSWG